MRGSTPMEVLRMSAQAFLLLRYIEADKSKRRFQQEIGALNCARLRHD